MNFKRFLGKLSLAIDVIRQKARVSYAQAGEDLIIEYLLASLNIKDVTYLEIGTNEPVLCNNTYRFYRKGCRGVCIEPDPGMFKAIKDKRPRDTVLNVGIGISDQKEAPFYLFPGVLNSWSTFSAAEANIRKTESGLQYDIIQVPLHTINSIIDTYFQICPNFISIDVEGLDLDILKSLDFNRFRPEVICVETISFSITNQEEKQQETINFMHSKGYITYADTHINTIFCKSELFKGGE